MYDRIGSSLYIIGERMDFSIHDTWTVGSIGEGINFVFYLIPFTIISSVD